MGVSLPLKANDILGVSPLLRVNVKVIHGRQYCDLTYRIKNDEANRIIKKLKGKKILIVGNHDNKYGMYDETLFEEICYYKEIKYDHIKYVLFHYPIEDWNGMYHGSIHLHGHSHNKPEYNLLMREKGLRRYDVGVDANDFRPVLLDDILDFFR